MSLLSLILAYQYHKQGGKGKLVYCTRTVQEMDKVVEELRRVMAFREKTILEQVKRQVRRVTEEEEKGQSGLRTDVDMTAEEDGSAGAGAAEGSPLSVRDPRILGVCLSSRRNLCIHSEVSSFDNRNKVDALCRNLTASFIREQHAQGSGVPICEFYEGYNTPHRHTHTHTLTCSLPSPPSWSVAVRRYEREGKESSLLGVYSLADLKVLGREKGWCPYFYARYAISLANVVVYNYQYMLDPKISGLVSRDMEKESIVVFDEAHNIDNIAVTQHTRTHQHQHTLTAQMRHTLQLLSPPSLTALLFVSTLCVLRCRVLVCGVLCCLWLCW